MARKRELPTAPENSPSLGHTRKGTASLKVNRTPNSGQETGGSEAPAPAKTEAVAPAPLPELDVKYLRVLRNLNGVVYLRAASGDNRYRRPSSQCVVHRGSSIELITLLETELKDFTDITAKTSVWDAATALLNPPSRSVIVSERAKQYLTSIISNKEIKTMATQAVTTKQKKFAVASNGKTNGKTTNGEVTKKKPGRPPKVAAAPVVEEPKKAAKAVKAVKTEAKAAKKTSNNEERREEGIRKTPSKYDGFKFTLDKEKAAGLREGTGYHQFIQKAMEFKNKPFTRDEMMPDRSTIKSRQEWSWWNGKFELSVRSGMFKPTKGEVPSDRYARSSEK